MSLPPIDQLLRGCGTWTTETITQDAVYFDTADLRLTRAGVSLRFRSDDGWTVKVPATDKGPDLVRVEHSFGHEVGAPPRAALELILPWARSHLVGEVARISTRRQRTLVLSPAGKPACEIDIDVVEGAALGRPPTHFREVEVETPERGNPRVSKRVVERLRRAGASAGPPRSKIARVLGSAADEPGDLASTVGLDRTATNRDLVRASITKAVRSLVDHDAAVRAGADPEAVHQARVATRRLRSHLHTFRPIVDEGWSESLRTELQWLGNELGAVRDADVLLDQLEARSRRLWGDLGPATQPITGQLREARERHHLDLLDAMRSSRYVALLDDLVEAARSPRMRSSVGDDRAVDSVGPLTHHPWKRLRDRVRAVSDPPGSAELHEVRKRAKQTRYAYEAMTPIVGKPARRLARRLTDLQDLLGDHHDATVAIDWLRAAAADAPDHEVSFAAGALAATFADDERRSAAQWRHTWHRAKRAH